MDITRKNIKKAKLDILKKYYTGDIEEKKEEIKKEAITLVKKIEEKV